MNTITNILNTIQSYVADKDNEEGQGLAEYALILALIAVVAVVALVFLGGAIQDILVDIGTELGGTFVAP